VEPTNLFVNVKSKKHHN